MTTCKVCNHEEVNAINEKLVTGVPLRDLEKTYDVGRMSLFRHREKHLPKTLIKAQALKEESAADDLLDRVEGLFDQAQDLMTIAKEDGKYAPAVAALKECRANLELIGKLLGELKCGTQINIHYNPQWVELKSTIYDVLKAYPEARLALVEKLTEIEEVQDAEFDG
jgi:hypothetical protein